jgi:DNA-directed RNA polymerase subunit K
MASKKASTAPAQEEKFMRFERARIVGARALQIAMGAPIILDIQSGFIDPVSIAEREFQNGLVPITVIRPEHAAPRRKKPEITVQPKFMRKGAA